MRMVALHTTTIISTPRGESLWRDGRRQIGVAGTDACQWARRFFSSTSR